MMKTLSLHMQTNNGGFHKHGKAGIHFMVNLSDHEVQCHNNKNTY
jgi:predicted PilT family ATPase